MNHQNFSRQPQKRREWNAVTYDYLGIATNSDQSRLYCLTDFQVAWLQANVVYYNWMTRWENNEATQDELNEQQAELETALMLCVQLQPYQVQFIYDAITIADFTGMNYRYDAGGIAGLNPDTPTDFYYGDESAYRVQALCTAINIYIRSYASNWITQAQIALGISVVVGILASISIVGGVIATVLVGGLAFITNTALLAMNDESALNSVVCCMNSRLGSLAVTEANFQTAFDDCSFSVGSNEQIIVDIISADITAFNSWLTFLNVLGDSYVLVQAGVTSCPCDDPTVYDFGINDQGWIIINTSVSDVPFSVYVAGEYFEETAVQNGSSTWFRYVNIEITEDIPTETIGHIDIEYWIEQPNSIVMTVNVATGGVPTQWNITSLTTGSWQTKTITVGQKVDEELQIILRGANNTPSVVARIRKVTLRLD